VPHHREAKEEASSAVRFHDVKEGRIALVGRRRKKCRIIAKQKKKHHQQCECESHQVKKNCKHR